MLLSCQTLKVAFANHARASKTSASLRLCVKKTKPKCHATDHPNTSGQVRRKASPTPVCPAVHVLQALAQPGENGTTPSDAQK